jgi:hypothetical protein
MILHNRIRQQAIIITDATSPVSASDRARGQEPTWKAKRGFTINPNPEVRYLVMAASTISNGIGKQRKEAYYHNP